MFVAMKEWLVIQHPCLLQFPFMTGFSLHPSFSFIPSVLLYIIVSVWEAAVSSFTFFAVLAENGVALKWEWNANVNFANILPSGFSQLFVYSHFSIFKFPFKKWSYLKKIHIDLQSLIYQAVSSPDNLVPRLNNVAIRLHLHKCAFVLNRRFKMKTKS